MITIKKINIQEKQKCLGGERNEIYKEKVHSPPDFWRSTDGGTFSASSSQPHIPQLRKMHLAVSLRSIFSGSNSFGRQTIPEERHNMRERENESERICKDTCIVKRVQKGTRMPSFCSVTLPHWVKTERQD